MLACGCRSAPACAKLSAAVRENNSASVSHCPARGLRPLSTVLQSGVSDALGWGCVNQYTGGQAGGYPKPPPHFICNRCNIPGHWKRDCPTKDDPAYDPKKAPVGIPMSRTKVITEEEAAASSEGVMKLQDGRYVQCMPSEYVQSLVVHFLISSVSVSVCCAQKSFCEEQCVCDDSIQHAVPTTGPRLPSMPLTSIYMLRKRLFLKYETPFICCVCVRRTPSVFWVLLDV